MLYDLRIPEIKAAFTKDMEAVMDVYHLSDEDRAPIRSKTLQPYLDAGVDSSIMRPLSEVLGVRPVILMPSRANMSGPAFGEGPEEANRKQKIEDLRKEFQFGPRG